MYREIEISLITRCAQAGIDATFTRAVAYPYLILSTLIKLTQQILYK